MTNQEAIDLLDDLIGMVDDDDDSKYDKALKIAIKVLKDLPSAQKWIPFDRDDNRLKDRYYYLITHTDYKTPIKAKWYSYEGEWVEPFTGKTLWHSWALEDNKVLAWMELPEPYRERSEDE